MQYLFFLFWQSEINWNDTKLLVHNLSVLKRGCLIFYCLNVSLTVFTIYMLTRILTVSAQFMIYT